jgi:hypothetical protein
LVFLEDNARLVLVLHTISAAALVAATTHMVVWMRGYRRRQFHRHAAVRRFAWISFGLFVSTFVIGNLAYPTYKVRVRGQYLDMPAAVEAARQSDREAERRLYQHHNQMRAVRGLPEAEVTHRPGISAREAAQAARWFDVKEHWVALGLGMSAALLFLVTGWDPRKHGANLGPLVFALAVGTAATTWLGAVVGIVVTSYRAIG